MSPLNGQTIIFLPDIDGTGVSFEPLRQVLPQDLNVKVMQYPTDRLLSFEETVQCAKEQIQTDQEDMIVLAESFSGPVGYFTGWFRSAPSEVLDPLLNICQVAKTSVAENPHLSYP